MAVRFGVIFITDDKTEELRSILERKKECNFIWLIESRTVIYNTPRTRKLNLIFIKKLITKIAFWDYLTC
ncbi:hypothetical protein oki352_09850 [Helicobacter pylori]